MMIALKIGACICLIIAVQMVVFLSDSFRSVSPVDDFIIIQKHEERVGSLTEYHILAKQPNFDDKEFFGKLGFGLNNTYSKSFYDMAELGDHIRTPNLLCLHTSLVRNGRVIKADFSGIFVLLSLHALIAFFPLIIFARFKNVLAKIILGICVGTVEMVTVVIFLYLLHVYYTD